MCFNQSLSEVCESRYVSFSGCLSIRGRWVIGLGVIKMIQFDINRSVFWQEIVLRGRSPEFLWRAITDPAVVGKYHIAPLQKLQLREGGVIAYGEGDGVIMHGIIRRVAEYEVLAHSVQFGQGNEVPNTMEVAYEISRDSDFTRLKVVHSGLSGDINEKLHLVELWTYVLRRLEWFLEKESGGRTNPASNACNRSPLRFY